ncbi:MAG: VWA domain-containing protein [Lachnospiraceae bacterium]|nr:VWA domain-containing protein [Ruminococcus sp.]MCM1274377.1 VWA domain-containing protein [Lachnospiraceae bacterium]
MKKYISAFTAIAAALALTGCSSGGVSATNGSAPTGGALSGGSLSGGAAEYSATDIGGKKPSLGDKISGIFGAAEDKTDGAFFAEAASEGGADGFAEETNGECYPPVDEDINAIPPQSGLLTGGEWNDNDHWTDWNALYDTQTSWSSYKETWRSATEYRLRVAVKADGKPLEGAKVTCGGCNTALTDNKGFAYLFSDSQPSASVAVECGGKSVQLCADWVLGAKDLYLTVDLDGAVSPIKPKLDLMIMCDTTGSMGDELEYLKVELEDIVKSIKSQNANIPTRVSVNFYRDTDDEYEVRQFPFSENIDEVAEAIRAQDAAGGGDFPEAVHTALDSAVNGHDWSADSVKIMFLVLDAPPHNDVQIIDSVNKYVAKAAETGIRIVPIASSGIDKSTEYLLRTMAFTTGGTYTFLTDDSGVGYGHIEPTVGAYNVEKLKDMMIRIVNGYLAEAAAVFAEPVKTDPSELVESYLNNEVGLSCTVVDCDFRRYADGEMGGLYMYTFKCRDELGYEFNATYTSYVDISPSSLSELIIDKTPPMMRGSLLGNDLSEVVAVTHTIYGKDERITLSDAECAAFSEWLGALKYEPRSFPFGETPGDSDGGEAYGLIFSSGEELSYVMNGFDKHYLFCAGEWYAVTNPSKPPIAAR